MKERDLQKVIFQYLSEPSNVFKSQNGKRLQILSPGRINLFDGPDFLDMAILLEGNILVGNSEFHRTSSDWFAHNHHTQESYQNLLLHIVFDYDTKDKTISCLDTLILNKDTILDYKNEKLNTIDKLVNNFNPDNKTLYNANNKVVNSSLKINSNSEAISNMGSNMDSNLDSNLETNKIIEDLQHFALTRLLRKTADVQKLINKVGFEEALKQFIKDFLVRYDSKRRRPVYNEAKLQSILDNINKSKSYIFLQNLQSNNYTSSLNLKLIDDLQLLLKSKINEEGSSLRREIIVNCILPFAICLANEENRILIFHWYWSTPSLNQYGILKRKFNNISQTYLWQQQGMLEYLREFGNKKNVVSESIKNYGFAEVLSFYKSGSNYLYNY